jgi:hypothetical protein
VRLQFTRRASLVVLLLLASVGTASAECTCVSLRTFTSEERGRFEAQYGIEWWKVKVSSLGGRSQMYCAERHWGLVERGVEILPRRAGFSIEARPPLDAVVPRAATLLIEAPPTLRSAPPATAPAPRRSPLTTTAGAL